MTDDSTAFQRTTPAMCSYPTKVMIETPFPVGFGLALPNGDAKTTGSIHCRQRRSKNQMLSGQHPLFTAREHLVHGLDDMHQNDKLKKTKQIFNLNFNDYFYF